MDIGAHIFRSPEYRSVVNEAVSFLTRTPVHFLPPEERFGGVGVYSLYYIGGSEIYEAIVRANAEALTVPIYVGKAVPKGWRAGRIRPVPGATNLYGRLREHRRSIDYCSDLAAKDFRCRFMILDGPEADLISSVEAELIRRYTPIWNTLIDGFGNHDPGSGRYNQAKSEWDVLHPGRPWADRLTGKSPKRASILKKLREQ